MQVITPASAMPQPLTCSSCQHWQGVAAHTPAEGERVGRCGRFAEIRPGTARPRCNICWEPVAALPTQETILADN